MHHLHPFTDTLGWNRGNDADRAAAFRGNRNHALVFGMVGRKDGIEVSFHIGVRIVVVRLLLGHSTGVCITKILFFFLSR